MSMQRMRGAAKAATLSVFVAFGFGTTVSASPFDQAFLLNLPVATVSTDLHGDLNGSVVTLNAAPPLSQLAIDLHSPPAFQLDSYDFAGTVCGILPCSKVTVEFNKILNPTVPVWQFDLGGTLDVGSNTFNLTGTPHPPGTIATLHAVLTPAISFQLEASAGFLDQIAASALFSALNNAIPTVTIDVTGTWDSIAATMSPSLLLSTTLAGTLTYDVDVELNNPIVNAIADALFPLLKNSILDLTGTSFLVDTFIDPFLGFSVPGMQQQCDTSPVATYELAITCEGTTQLALSSVPTVNVPEPGSLALLGLGFAGLGLRRSRRVT